MSRDSDTAQDYRAFDEIRKKLRQEQGKPCKGCMIKFPKANPKILLPGQKCFCGWQDKRTQGEIA